MSGLRGIDGRFVPGVSASPWTQFRPGERSSPSTEIQPGQRLSPATEFKKGTLPRNHRAVGSETVRTNRRTGERRAWVKIAEPNVWRARAVVVWETAHGPLEAGCTVHHQNRDTLDDRIENLEMLTRAQHAFEHAAEKHGARFLGEERVRAIVAAWNAGGKSKLAIAREFGVPGPTVSALLLGRTWSHLGLEIRRTA